MFLSLDGLYIIHISSHYFFQWYQKHKTRRVYAKLLEKTKQMNVSLQKSKQKMVRIQFY